MGGTTSPARKVIRTTILITNLNQPSFKDLVLGQVKINENLTRKLMSNDKMLENINSQIESLSSAVKNQLSCNKMIETQISQIAAAIPIDHSGKTSGQTQRRRKSLA